MICAIQSRMNSVEGITICHFVVFFNTFLYVIFVYGCGIYEPKRLMLLIRIMKNIQRKTHSALWLSQSSRRALTKLCLKKYRKVSR